MASQYPASFDSFTNPGSTQTLKAGGHAALHGIANDAIVALQRNLGTNPPISPEKYGAVLNGLTDTTTALQAWATGIAGKIGRLPAGTYKLSGAITLQSNTTIIMEKGVTLVQTVPNTVIFQLTQVENVAVYCNGAILFGEGSWSPLWTGMSGHADRGFQIYGCTNCEVHDAVIRNMANAGIAILGGSGIRIVRARIEGTHTYSTPLSPSDNFQVGIFVEHNTTYGAYSDILLDTPEISGTAQGILTGNTFGALTGALIIKTPHLHDIPGQHGMYLNNNDITVISAVVKDCNTSGIKWQTTTNVRSGLTVLGAKIQRCGGQAVEISAIEVGGALSGLLMDSINIDNCARGLSISGKLSDSKFSNWNISDITFGSAQHGVFIDEDDSGALDNVEFTNFCINRVQQWGLLMSAPGSVKVRFNGFTIREAAINGASSGIQHAGGEAEYNDIEVHDSGAHMLYGFYASAVGARLGKKLVITGAATNPVRADALIEGWPTDARIGNLVPVGVANIRFDADGRFYQQSTSATNAVLWRQTLDDETAYLITAEIVGKHSDGSQRASYVSSVLVYRDGGGGATVEGTADEVAATASAGFTGVYSWSPNANDIRLFVNSGGATTINWRVRVRVTKI